MCRAASSGRERLVGEGPTIIGKGASPGLIIIPDGIMEDPCMFIMMLTVFGEALAITMGQTGAS
jgi:hypothetical protein